MPDRNLIAEGRKALARHDTDWAMQFLDELLDELERYREQASLEHTLRCAVRDLEAELADARAHIAELEQQASQGAPAMRCQTTTTLGDLVRPPDHRAIWCQLPLGHAGHHHGEVPQWVSMGVEGVKQNVPMMVDWPEVNDHA